MNKGILGKAILAALAAAVWCAGKTYDDVSVTAGHIDALDVRHGYIECRFIVQNHHDTQARTVRIAMGEPSGYHLLHEVARTVKVEPLKQVESVLWVPAWPGNIAGARVTIDGVPQEEEVEVHVRWDHSGQPVLYVSRGINRDYVEKKLDPKKKHSSSYYSSNLTIARSDDEVAQWPATWLSYTPYDGIMVHAREWRQMPEAVNEALREYVYAGGMLCIVGTNTLPAWPLVRDMPSALVRDMPSARARMRYIVEGNAACAGGAYGSAGFGTLLAVPADGPQQFSSNLVRYLCRTLESQNNVWDLPGNIEQVHARFPITSAITVPFRWLLGLCVLFAAVIGPVNIYVLHRLKRRIWLLWTTPALALVATASVVLYALVSEGTRPALRMSSVTLLDQPTHHAVTMGAIGYYFPMVPGGGFMFDRTTEISPAVRLYYRERGTGPLLIDWTRGQEVAGRLARARIPLYLRQRSTGLRRERMVFTPRGNGVQALNGLGTTVQVVWYVDAGGGVWYASNIAAGAVAPLTRKEPPPRCGSTMYLTELPGGYWDGMAAKISKDAYTYLEPGTYIAALADDPFIDTGYRGATRERRAENVVIGFTEGADHE